MKIFIAGCGEVGSHLAKLLSREEQDITVIDEDSSKLAALDSNYNLLTIQGRPHHSRLCIRPVWRGAICLSP